MLSVCTTAQETQWASLGDFLTLLGTTASSSGMDKALTDATRWVEGYILGEADGVMRRQVYQETVQGSGSQRLMLSRTPVARIQRFFNATDTCEAVEYCSTDFRIENDKAGFVELTGDAGFPWTPVMDWRIAMYPRPAAVTRPYLVVYEAGWQLTPATSTSEYATTSTMRTLPEDIERAVLLKAADLYQGSPNGISSMTVGPLSVNYNSEAQDPVKALLANYRRVV